MKITDVEAIVLRRHDPVRDISDGTQDTLVVRIHTDAGLVGIGEVDSAPEVVKAAIEAPKSHLTCAGFRQLLLGEDPRDVGRLWEKLYRGSLYFGRRGVGIHALSGIDIALWDLCGKALGQPVHRLLGRRPPRPGARLRVHPHAGQRRPRPGARRSDGRPEGSPRSSSAGAASGSPSTPTSPSSRPPGARWATGSRSCSTSASSGTRRRRSGRCSGWSDSSRTGSRSRSCRTTSAGTGGSRTRSTRGSRAASSR